MESLSYELALLLLATGLLAGVLDSIAGGGGLIAFPVILSTGMSPLQALATNKLQGSFGTSAAAWHFLRHGHLDWRDMRLAVLCTFVGAVLGTLLVQRVSNQFLLVIIPLLLVANALYFLLSPRIGDIERHRRMGSTAFALLVGCGIGFYDGFFGPGTGTFFALAFVALLGYGMARATAHTKLLNMTSNLAALLFFALGGHVVWSVGLLMAVGQVAGASIGAHLVIRRGTALVRPLLVIVSLALTIRLVLQNADNPLRYLWGG